MGATLALAETPRRGVYGPTPDFRRRKLKAAHGRQASAGHETVDTPMAYVLKPEFPVGRN